MTKPEPKLSKKAFQYALENIKIKSIRQIAIELDVDHSYLRKKLKKEAAYSEPRSGRPRKDVDVERILILYKSGIGCQKIAKMFGVHEDTIGKRIREAVGTKRTMRHVWIMRKNGGSEESVQEYMARSGGVAKNKAAVDRLKELDNTIDEIVEEKMRQKFYGIN